jgi:gas vesicle protein
MQSVKRLGAFVLGGTIGAGVGALVALLVTPESGDDLKKRARGLATRAQHEGDTARVEKEAELRQRFRSSVDDPTALRDEA